MSDSIKNLRSPEQVNPNFAISENVMRGAALWALRYEERGLNQNHLVCLRCEQSVMLVGTEDTGFLINAEMILARVVSHLIQRHGWTRENSGV